MSDSISRICLWSGPRNVSTALMYSFAQRSDTKVFDEPLYAHYLRESKAKEYHPMATEIIESMENDGRNVVEMMCSNHGKSVLFFKQMTHHLISLNWDFLSKMKNVILTRDPYEMLPSFAKEIDNPTMHDVGYLAHIELLKYLDNTGQNAVVIDSKDILLNPEAGLKELCKALGIPFEKEMLSWPAGPIKEDGVWASHWYGNVHKSVGFKPYEKKLESFPEKLKPLLEKCIPLYNQLRNRSLKFEHV